MNSIPKSHNAPQQNLKLWNPVDYPILLFIFMGNSDDVTLVCICVCVFKHIAKHKEETIMHY